MTWWLLNEWPDRHNYEIIIVFSNTGKEKEPTLEFVRNCDLNFGFNTVWIEAVTNQKFGEGVTANVVSFETANRDGQVFEDMISKYGIPNKPNPHCSRQLKKEAIRAYARSIAWVGQDYITAVGYRIDEPARINWETLKKENLFYPFVTLKKVSRNDVNIFWSKQSFDLELKSYEGNCDLCWKKSIRKLMTLSKNEPKLTNWWREMEIKYGNYIPESRQHRKDETKLPIRFYRDQRSVDDIIEESKFPFVEAQDESKIIYPVNIAGGMWDEYLDTNDGCVETCEAFS